MYHPMSTIRIQAAGIPKPITNLFGINKSDHKNADYCELNKRIHKTPAPRQQYSSMLENRTGNMHIHDHTRTVRIAVTKTLSYLLKWQNALMTEQNLGTGATENINEHHATEVHEID